MCVIRVVFICSVSVGRLTSRRRSPAISLLGLGAARHDTHTHAYTHEPSLSLTHTPQDRPTYTPTHSDTHTRTHTETHTHTHTHRKTHTHTHPTHNRHWRDYIIDEEAHEFPLGWEQRVTPTGMVYFVDHVHRTTTVRVCVYLYVWMRACVCLFGTCVCACVCVCVFGCVCAWLWASRLSLSRPFL